MSDNGAGKGQDAQDSNGADPNAEPGMDPLSSGEGGRGVTLDGLRAEIRDVDHRILELVAERLRLAQTIGDEKRKRNLPIQDFRVEKQVIDAAEKTCEALGIDTKVGADVMRPLIRSAVKLQESSRVRGRHAAGGRRVLIVGGAGLMGRWFADFLGSQGHTVTILDPGGPVPGYAHATEIDDAVHNAEVIIVATPPSVTSSILDDIGMARTDAVVFDICSLKSPIRGSLESLQERGFSVCSIHPMFGPDADLLSGRHVVVCPLGDKRAVQAVRAFFQDTCATLVEMSLEDHDRLVSYVLGLSHAVNIMFNDVLARSERDLDSVREIGSTTFNKQIEVAGQLARENPDLYYEIQALNRYTPQMLESVRASLDSLIDQVEHKDREGFAAMMQRARRFYGLNAGPEARA